MKVSQMLRSSLVRNVYRLYNELEKNKFIENLLKTKKPKQFLDIGVGSGTSAAVLARLNKNISVKGLDIKNDLWTENKGIKISIYDGYKMPFAKDSFDCSLIFFVLHHSESPRLLLSEAKRITSEHILIIEEIKLNYLHNLLMMSYDFLVNWLIFGHRISLPSFMTENGLEELIKKTGLKIKAKLFLKSGLLTKRVAYLLYK